MNGTFDEGTSDAFRKLGRYIGVFGTAQNEGSNTIAMTAPVINSPTPLGESIEMTAPVISIG